MYVNLLEAIKEIQLEPSREDDMGCGLYERCVFSFFFLFSDFLLLHINRMAGKGALAHGPVDLKHKHYFFIKA